MTDLYGVLGVTPTVSARELEHAFRILVRQYHPDTRGADAAGTADRRLEQILAAYAVLRDPVTRSAYDERVNHHRDQERRSAQHQASHRQVFVRRPAYVRAQAFVPGPTFLRRHHVPQDGVLRVGPVRWQRAPPTPG